MRRLTILHTNDIHARMDAIGRIATLVGEASSGRAHPLLYVDGGDAEDRTERLSNLTKGVAVHRLLGVAGCRAAAVGNGTVIYYGADPLVAQTAAGGYPQLAANLRRNGALGTYGGYAAAEWGLEVEWDGTTIVREAIEEHLRRHPVIAPPEQRIDGPLALARGRDGLSPG